MPGRPRSATLAAGMPDVILVREWDADVFHRRVLDLESQGYTSRRDSYRISPEMDPQTGKIVHLYTMEMSRAVSSDRKIGSSDQ